MCVHWRALHWTALVSFLGKRKSCRCKDCTHPTAKIEGAIEERERHQVPQLWNPLFAKLLPEWWVGCILRSCSKPSWSYSLLIRNLLVAFLLPAIKVLLKRGKQLIAQVASLWPSKEGFLTWHSSRCGFSQSYFSPRKSFHWPRATRVPLELSSGRNRVKFQKHWLSFSECDVLMLVFQPIHTVGPLSSLTQR